MIDEVLCFNIKDVGIYTRYDNLKVNTNLILTLKMLGFYYDCSFIQKKKLVHKVNILHLRSFLNFA